MDMSNIVSNCQLSEERSLHIIGEGKTKTEKYIPKIY